MTDKEIEIQYALGVLPIKILRPLSYRKNTSPRILDVLSNDKDLNIINNVSANPNTPEHTLFKIFQRCKLYIGQAFEYDLALNPNLPVELLVKLSKSRHTAVRSNVAGNIATPKEILIILTKDKDKGVRYPANNTLARQRNNKILEKIYNDY